MQRVITRQFNLTLKAALLASLVSISGVASAATPSASAQAEIAHLLSYLETSRCELHRNGTWHDSSEARAHLEKKKDYLVKRSVIGSAKDFIDKAATMKVWGVYAFFTILALASPIGVIILAQDEVIQEKQSGTAAWILSKPASRPAFILTKLLSNILGALVFIVLLPGLVAWVLGYLATHVGGPLVPFLAGAGVFMLGLIFFISLVILLGVLCESRGPVLGIAFGIILGGMLLRSFIPQILYVLPLSMDSVAMAAVLGMPLPAFMVSQVISTAVLSIAFILAALWRFKRIEL